MGYHSEGPYRIPEAELETIGRLLRYPAETFEAICHVLETAEPAVQMDYFAPNLAAEAGLEEDEAAAILELLSSMYQTLDRSPNQDAFLARLKRSLADEPSLSSIADDWHNASEKLRRLLSFENSIGVTAKARGLLIQHEHFYCKGRILTNLRPVYKRDLGTPVASIIYHELRITYHKSDDSDTRDIYIAATKQHLLRLRSLIDRALQKEDGLRNHAQQGGLIVLED